jgi:hypothetical protein
VSIRVVTRDILICDGCAVEQPEAASATEARANAWAEGWRFPRRATISGAPSSRTSDVCPGCLPGWTAAPSTRPRNPGAGGAA